MGFGLGFPRGIAVDGSGNAYVAGYSTSNAFKIAPGGVITEIIDHAGGVGSILDTACDIAVDGSSNVYVAGRFSNNAFKISPGGVITRIIDYTGDGQGAAFFFPQGIAVDGSGNAYVTGEFTDNAFKITSGGVISQIIDSTGDGRGSVHTSPWDIAVDGSGNAYVTGRDSHNAFKIAPLIYAGSGEDLATTYSVNGGSFFTAGPETFASIFPGDFVSICHSSPGGTFVGTGPTTVFGSTIPTGTPFPSPFPGLHVNSGTAFLIISSVNGNPVVMPSPGICYGFVYSGGGTGINALIQCFVSDSNAANGIFASTSGLDLRFQ